MKECCYKCSTFTNNPEHDSYKCKIGDCPGIRCKVCDIKSTQCYISTYKLFKDKASELCHYDDLCNECFRWLVKMYGLSCVNF